MIICTSFSKETLEMLINIDEVFSKLILRAYFLFELIILYKQSTGNLRAAEEILMFSLISSQDADHHHLLQLIIALISNQIYTIFSLTSHFISLSRTIG